MTEPKTSSSAGHIAAGKDLVALLRDAALLALAVLLIAFPDTLNERLVRAGFEEGNVAGFKWKKTVTDQNLALRDTKEALSELQKKNAELAKALADATARSGDAALKQAAATLQADNQKAVAAAGEATASAQATLQTTQPVVQSALERAGVQRWGVVFGGDRTLPAAQHEIADAKAKQGLGPGQIYFRQGSYRSVSVQPQHDAAEAALKLARQRRADAYVVDMDRWCPQPVQKAGYFECP